MYIIHTSDELQYLFIETKREAEPYGKHAFSLIIDEKQELTDLQENLLKQLVKSFKSFSFTFCNKIIFDIIMQFVPKNIDNLVFHGYMDQSIDMNILQKLKIKKLWINICPDLQVVNFGVNRVKIDKLQIKECKKLTTLQGSVHIIRSATFHSCQQLIDIDCITRRAEYAIETFKFVNCFNITATYAFFKPHEEMTLINVAEVQFPPVPNPCLRKLKTNVKFPHSWYDEFRMESTSTYVRCVEVEDE